MADLFADLWDASFNGVPFYIERDDGEDGRRLVVHTFPLVDEPFIEDLGRKVRRYSIEAYIVGDDYATAAPAFIEALAGEPGPGTLVLPMEGPVNVRFHTSRRGRGKDRTGYVSLHLEFIREGIATALVSVGFLAQLAFDANAALGSSLSVFAGQLSAVRQPAWIVEAAAAGLRDAVALVDAVRADNTVDPVKSYDIGNALADLYGVASTAVSPLTGLDVTFLPKLVATARSLAAAMPARTAMAAFASAVEGVAQPLAVASGAGVSSNRMAAAGNAAIVARSARLVVLSAYADAVVNAAYTSRPDGVTARARFVEALDVELALCRGALDADLYVALQDLRNAVVAYLTNLIATLAPVVTVTANVPLPSLVLAWRLSPAPTRAPALVARNGVRHPSYMPERIEALAASA